jgi:hypothetical protein
VGGFGSRDHGLVKIARNSIELVLWELILNVRSNCLLLLELIHLANATRKKVAFIRSCGSKLHVFTDNKYRLNLPSIGVSLVCGVSFSGVCFADF